MPNDHAHRLAVLDELVANLREARIAADLYSNPGRFVVVDQTTAALTLGPKNGGIGFSFAFSPTAYRLGMATDIAAQWNELHPNNSVEVVTCEQWREARLEEIANLERQIPEVGP